MTKKEFVFLLICTFIVGMLWLGYDIFFKTKASIEVSPSLESILDPLDPNFDQETLDLIGANSSVPNPPAIPASQTPITSPAPISSSIPSNISRILSQPSPSSQASSSAFP